MLLKKSFNLNENVLVVHKATRKSNFQRWKIPAHTYLHAVFLITSENKSS